MAREAGVSIATVSRVMQGRPSVSPDLARRVREVARHLGYSPSPMARGLATGSTGMVGILVPQLSNPYFHELIKAIGVGADHDGYRMLVLESDERVADEPDLAASLYAHADGVILCSPRMADDDLERVTLGRPRLLCVNRIARDGQPPGIACDMFSPMLDICRLLATQGHRRVVYFAGAPYSWVNAERWRAVQHSAALGLDPLRVQAGPSIDAGYAATDAALALSPTALIAANDLCAIGVLTRLREVGLQVPRDVSLTGFDDIPFSRHTLPALTTARIPRLELGRQVWAMMRAVLADEAPPARVLATAEVVVRDSTGPAPASGIRYR
ncbi:MAG: LacI family transcriptional regulator [Actinobacteria bacterium]|nr:LacI family transcriptional regulator [Actinomycetota bacterium]